MLPRDGPVPGADVVLRSLNVVKLYSALLMHLEHHPEQRSRFPGLRADRKVILAKGSSDPVAGENHSAEYFHGRYVEVPALQPQFSRIPF